ncbi:PfkB family carbohydrate kinase (plasmid) [Acetobacter orientalis]|uniref:PfkB family carbohydrate kinase n=2 Tax=Acetobacter orientalis TaxID=146474 RepID=UPI0038689928
MGGGSAANTCVVAAQFGARFAYLGKMACDNEGEKFTQGLRENGITFPSAMIRVKSSASYIEWRFYSSRVFYENSIRAC